MKYYMQFLRSPETVNHAGDLLFGKWADDAPDEYGIEIVRYAETIIGPLFKELSVSWGLERTIIRSAIRFYPAEDNMQRISPLATPCIRIFSEDDLDEELLKVENKSAEMYRRMEFEKAKETYFKLRRIYEPA
jgi:hypothetical protein